MKRLSLSMLMLGTLGMTACGGAVHNKSALNQYRTSKAKVALVSLTVNDYAGILKQGNLSGADVDTLIDKKLGEMLSLTENMLGAHFSVTSVTDFGSKDEYQSLSSREQFEVFRPRFEGKPMPIFATSRSDLIKSRVTAEQAKGLCTALGVDMVAIVYTEWQTRTGGFVPTTKTVAKTVLAIFDKSGEQLFSGRQNSIGGNVGAFGKTGITENSIQKWVDAYDKSLQFLVDGL